MEICEQLNSILKPLYVQATKVKLSYIDELLPDLKDKQYIVLHKNNFNEQCSNYQDKEKSSSEYSTKHDITGSPLEYSFGKDEFEDTIIITKHMWRKEEELYLPLSRNTACNATNMCLEQFDDNTLSILAICDGEDSKQSMLIGAIVFENWFTTIEVISTGATSLATVKNNCRKMVKDHLKQSSAQEHSINISMLTTFDLFGTKQELIDWSKVAKRDYEGSINVQVHSSNLDLDLRQSRNIIMTAEINTEWKNSPLTDIRHQLLLLMQYLSIIDECNKHTGKLQESIKFATPYLQNHNIICEKLELLLNGDSDFKLNDNNHVENVKCIKEKENVEIDVKLRERVQSICLRNDVDFTDLLWEIVIKASDYSQMVRCIETVLKEILENKFTPQANDTNSTRLIKYVYDLRHRETTSYVLAGSVPLELVVDIGFEKLIRDYQYVLGGAQLVNAHNVRKKLADVSSGIFSTEKYRKKLVILAQIHVCLECMLLIEEHIEQCSVENLQRVFAKVYEEFVSEQSPLQQYTELCSRVFIFTTSLPIAVANELNKINPFIRRVCVSSKSATSMLTTTTYYSKMPIFPMYKCSTDVNSREETMYGVSATSSSIKFKKLDRI